MRYNSIHSRLVRSIPLRTTVFWSDLLYPNHIWMAEVPPFLGASSSCVSWAGVCSGSVLRGVWLGVTLLHTCFCNSIPLVAPSSDLSDVNRLTLRIGMSHSPDLGRNSCARRFRLSFHVSVVKQGTTTSRWEGLTWNKWSCLSQLISGLRVRIVKNVRNRISRSLFVIVAWFCCDFSQNLWFNLLDFYI